MKNEAQYMLSICLIFGPILRVHMLIGFMLIKKRCILTWCETATVGKSLHVRRKFSLN